MQARPVALGLRSCQRLYCREMASWEERGQRLVIMVAYHSTNRQNWTGPVCFVSL